jgi:hypothetical protein
MYPVPPRGLTCKLVSPGPREAQGSADVTRPLVLKEEGMTP